MQRYQIPASLLLLAILCVAGLAQERGDVLIRNATILTASHGTIENGSILIRNGKIAAVGKDVTASPGAKVIDGTGMYVTPGLIDAHSHSASDDGGVNEGTVSVSSMVRMRDIINDQDPNIYRQLAGGTTTIHLMHGSANSIGGQNVVLKLKWGKNRRGNGRRGCTENDQICPGRESETRGKPNQSVSGRWPATALPGNPYGRC